MAEDDLVAETRRLWDAKAAFWDAAMGEGNALANDLIGPAVERLLAIHFGDRVLDAGCGNGVISRRLARLGAKVTGVALSARFLDLARARSAERGDRIDHRLVDATDEAQLLALDEGSFDAIVSTMAMMDMPTTDPLLRAGKRLLAAGGRFVFAIQHPAFTSNAVTLCSETVTLPDGREATRYSVRVSGYLHVSEGKAIGMIGEPGPHWCFHRPLHELFGACFASGFVIDGLEEPGSRRGSSRCVPPGVATSWVSCPCLWCGSSPAFATARREPYRELETGNRRMLLAPGASPRVPSGLAGCARAQSDLAIGVPNWAAWRRR